MTQVFLSLGSNKGDRLSNINNAVENIGNSIGEIINVSEVFETKSWGYDDFDYLNIVVMTKTLLSPKSLLAKTQRIEKELGRKTKSYKQGENVVYRAREIDIDILFFGNKIINSRNLTVPHPLLHLRSFVLEPLLQVAPGFIHPVFNLSIKELEQNINQLRQDL